MTKKTNNHNTLKKKTVTNWSEYLNTISLQMAPANDDSIKRIAIELITWARECKDAFLISQFYNMKGISESTYYFWVDKHEIMKEANKIALSLISERRELYLKDRDPSSVRYMMPQYSEMWKREDERRAVQKLRKDSDDEKIINVIMDNHPSSKLLNAKNTIDMRINNYGDQENDNK